MFMFSVCFVQGLSNYLVEQDLPELDAAGDEHWGSITRAMGTLWIATGGGVDWKIVADSLWDVGSPYYYLFMLYIGFFLFVVANTLTGLFVDAARQYSERDHQQVIQNQLHK